MSWRELRRYIEGLHRAGFDVSTLTVQWHEKIAFPLLAPVSMLLAIPFAFLVGTRGAVGGVALGVGFGIVYWSVAKLLEALWAELASFRRFLAGWSPDNHFLFPGLVLFLQNADVEIRNPPERTEIVGKSARRRLQVLLQVGSNRFSFRYLPFFFFACFFFKPLLEPPPSAQWARGTEKR